MICITDDDLFVSNTKPKPISKTRRSSLIAQSHLRHVPTEYTLSPEEPNFPAFLLSHAVNLLKRITA